jgi:hypothetical protein
MNNGYAYEHMIVAEETIGRRLSIGEVVHHINGIKTDNRPENIEVCGSIAEHKALHRQEGCSRRLPKEENALRNCACGCGASFMEFDEHGRRRTFLSGHVRKGKKGGWARAAQ